MKHSKVKNTRTSITEIYGIIYRIYCIPENKSYIGQTFSHSILKKYYQKCGILTRCKKHYTTRLLENLKARPLYVALDRYGPDNFEVFEEKRLYGEELSRINIIEGEYMEKYNSLSPNGYNLEKIGKKYGKLYKELAAHYGFEIERETFEYDRDSVKTKEICFGVRFDMYRTRLTNKLILDTLTRISIDKVKLVYTNGFRIIIYETSAQAPIRLYYNKTREEVLKFAQQISPNIEQTPSFLGETCYKYQNKLDKALEHQELYKLITGAVHLNNTNGCKTYSIGFRGTKNGKSCLLFTISFGGVNLDIHESFENAMEFLEKYENAAQTKNYTVKMTILLTCKNNNVNV